MKKILIWTAMPMMECPSNGKILAKNLFGNNTGNMLFLTSVTRALMTDDDVQFESIFDFDGKSEELVERINAEFDCFAIPLANAFRSSYEEKLQRLTALVSRLKIPCVVIGVGVQAEVGESVNKGFRFDKAVKEFVRAVLEKSVMMGVRGEYTASYLRYLGFSEDKDFTVIGCPSVYMWGKQLPDLRRTELSKQSTVSINGKNNASSAIHKWMRKSCEILPNYYYIPQRIEELWMSVYGIPLLTVGNKEERSYMPLARQNPVIRDGRSVGFTNAYAWIEFMKNINFSYGCNIHGNIAAILAGTPCMVIERDKRVSELAQYLDIPLIAEESVRLGRNVIELYEQADYSALYRNHPVRFARFVDFLKVNGLVNIYEKDIAPGEAPYDLLMKRVGPALPLYPRKMMEILCDKWTVPVFRRAFSYYAPKAKARMKKMLK